jgi:hypothetical protein
VYKSIDNNDWIKVSVGDGDAAILQPMCEHPISDPMINKPPIVITSPPCKRPSTNRKTPSNPPDQSSDSMETVPSSLSQLLSRGVDERRVYTSDDEDEHNTRTVRQQVDTTPVRQTSHSPTRHASGTSSNE